MLVAALRSRGFRNSRLAFLFGVTCQPSESPIETFSIRSSAANSSMVWMPK
jgi:hypothetical protein